MAIEELTEWFKTNLDLVDRFSGDVVFFAIEWPDPEGEDWRAGYKHWGDDGDTYFYRSIVGSGSTLNAALEAGYKKTEPLITELQKLVDAWQTIRFRDLGVGDCIISYGLNWDGELTKSVEKVTDIPPEGRYAPSGRLYFESGERLFSYRPETFARCCQIVRD